MIQQNQLIDIYNHFRLLTSESWTSQNRWSTIVFYPDVSEAGGFATANRKFAPATTTSNNSALNEGLAERLEYVLDDSGLTLDGIATSTLSNLISKTELSKLYVSQLSTKTAGTTTDALTTGTAGVSPVLQYSVKATIMLKDIHPLFEVMPISISLNFKIQKFWNNSVATATHDGANWTTQSAKFKAHNGTLPLMLNNFTDGFSGATAGTLRASVYVGDTCYDSTQNTAGTLSTGGVGKQVELYIQAVQMLPDIESNYAQNHMRDISYHDYYQFTL
jgi:hypothetical protein